MPTKAELEAELAHLQKKLELLEESKVDFASLAHQLCDNHIRALEWDTSIAKDKFRFSAWILGVGTAGFALAISQAENILEGSLIGEPNGKWLVVAGSVLFLMSALFGAMVKHFITEGNRCRRIQMTYMLVQQANAVGNGSTVVTVLESTDFSTGDLGEMISVGGLIASDMGREAFMKTSASEDKANSRFEKCLLVQQVLVAIGYLVLLVASFG